MGDWIDTFLAFMLAITLLSLTVTVWFFLIVEILDRL